MSKYSVSSRRSKFQSIYHNLHQVPKLNTVHTGLYKMYFGIIIIHVFTLKVKLISTASHCWFLNIRANAAFIDQLIINCVKVFVPLPIPLQ